jgi:hypothetical protein
MLARMRTSSLNEALDAPDVQKISDEFAQALQAVLENHEDAVGVAIVINGKIEEANVYPNLSLLKKLYPRLLQSYALQATLEKDKAKEAHVVEPADIVKFITEDRSKPRRQQSINADNTAQMVFDSKEEAATTYYKGGAVHRQVLSKSSPSGEK